MLSSHAQREDDILFFPAGMTKAKKTQTCCLPCCTQALGETWERVRTRSVLTLIVMMDSVKRGTVTSGPVIRRTGKVSRH